MTIASGVNFFCTNYPCAEHSPIKNFWILGLDTVGTVSSNANLTRDRKNNNRPIDAIIFQNAKIRFAA